MLNEDERADLNQRLLVHTLEILTGLPEIEHVLVVSRDPAALALARDYGARTLQENGAPGLNIALTRATVVAGNYGTHGILILPADLPLLTQEDVRELLSRDGDSPVVVISPDRHYEGTNALLVCPPGLIKYGFGPGSYQRHCERAHQAGARLEIVELPSLALDMDLPEDLERVSEELEQCLEQPLMFEELLDY